MCYFQGRHAAKAVNWGAATLAQVDNHFVQVPLDEFKDLIPGEDLHHEQLQDLPDFAFLKRLKNEHAKYNPLVRPDCYTNELCPHPLMRHSV